MIADELHSAGVDEDLPERGNSHRPEHELRAGLPALTGLHDLRGCEAFGKRQRLVLDHRASEDDDEENAERRNLFDAAHVVAERVGAFDTVKDGDPSGFVVSAQSRRVRRECNFPGIDPRLHLP